jgi:hypothetical protein
MHIRKSEERGKSHLKAALSSASQIQGASLSFLVYQKGFLFELLNTTTTPHPAKEKKKKAPPLLTLIFHVQSMKFIILLMANLLYVDVIF